MRRRREFIALLGSAAAVWPAQIRGQWLERIRRMGIFMNLPADDAETQARRAALVKELRELGWVEGRNIQIDYRFGAGEAEQFRKYASELIDFGPELIIAHGTPIITALRQASQTIPIIFVAVTDPVGAGVVANLARPGGNSTGFSNFEYGMGAKWLEILKEISPQVTRVAVIRDPTTTLGVAQFAAMQSVAPALAVEISAIGGVNAGELERNIKAFARSPETGLIVSVGALGAIHRDLIIRLAREHRLPAVYPLRYHVSGGGLISYGPDTLDQYRRAAGYVDRILKGEKPADLPVQAPTKYELVINLKTAKALGLDVPPILLARADEVIE
jgi:putative ABC transport system substrate-binding protein